ncbi:MAG: hypothetical protein IVW57_04165, partial [Ktedonobacterales bacterium]|nr:hypothetical protein [Ktedonobacterales bacterium]
MFCMVCGAEVASHLTACPSCGKPVSVRAPSSGELGDAMRDETLPAIAPPLVAAPLAPPPAVTGFADPSIGYGDVSGSLLPRDTLGRVVVATSAAMAVDVLAPWVSVGGVHTPLVRIGAPVLALLAVLGLPLVAVRPT